jgi:hypothetical protein
MEVYIVNHYFVPNPDVEFFKIIGHEDQFLPPRLSGGSGLG